MVYFMCTKGHCQQNKNATHRIRKIIYKLCIDKDLITRIYRELLEVHRNWNKIPIHSLIKLIKPNFF